MKIFIIGHTNINTYEIGNHLQSLNDNLSITPLFITSDEYDTDIFPYMYVLDTETVNISYKNNALLYVNTSDNYSYGITCEDYYNNDILCMNISDFNTISNVYFKESEEILIVWVDSSSVHGTDNDLYEIPYLEERLENLNYLYMCNESADEIANIINEYIIGDCETRNRILLENS